MARIVFDLDGTLIDSVEDVRAIANAVLADVGAAPLAPAEARAFIGNGAAVFVSRMRAARALPEGDEDRLLAAFMSRYHDTAGQAVPYPGVPEALDALRAAGHRLGVCTNKPVGPTRAELARLALSPFFEVAVGAGSTRAIKPDPLPLETAFGELGTGPRLYVGDSEVDAETARRAAVPFLLFTHGYRRGAVADIAHDRAFDDFAELPSLVAELLAIGADRPQP